MSAPETPAHGEGLLDSLRGLLDTFIDAIETRLALLAVDLEDERDHLLTHWVLVLGVIYCLGVSLVLASMVVVLAFWDSYRLQALGSLSGLFLVFALLAGGYLARRRRLKPSLFKVTLAELAKDRDQLRP